MMMKLPRNVKALGITSLFNDIASEMIFPILPLFLTACLGASKSAVGLIEGIAESTSSILKLLSGYLSDRIGKRKIFAVTGYAIPAILRPLISLANSFFQVLFIRFADRIGKGLRTAPRDAIIASSTTAEIRGKAFGFHRAMDHAGAFFGPIIATAGLFLLGENEHGMRTIFLIALIPGIICTFSLILGVSEKENLQKNDKKEAFEGLRKFSGNFYAFILINFLFTISNSSDAFLILKASDCGISALWIPLIWSLHSLVKSVSSIPFSALSDRFGRKKVIISGWICYGLVYGGFSIAGAPVHIVLLFAAYGLYYGFCEGTEKAFIADLTDEKIRGTAYGLYHFSIAAASLPSSILFGFLWDKFGSSFAFQFSAAISIISAAAMFLFIRDKK